MNIVDAAALFARYKSGQLSRTLHSNDVMYNTGADWYYVVGESAIECITSSLTFTRLANVERVLDLPCGHGRVGRHLRAAFPDATIYFSDLDREGVDFCSSEFGGEPVYSVPDLTRANLPNELDLIWVGSLFTHVSRDQTFDWLGFLSKHLRANGLIVATFHGYFTRTNPPDSARVDLAQLRREFDATGYGFENYPAGDAVKLERYGFSISKPSAILDMADAIPDTRVASYIERGWAHNHDVLALCRDDRLRPFGK